MLFFPRNRKCFTCFFKCLLFNTRLRKSSVFVEHKNPSFYFSFVSAPRNASVGHTTKLWPSVVEWAPELENLKHLVSVRLSRRVCIKTRERLSFDLNTEFHFKFIFSVIESRVFCSTDIAKNWFFGKFNISSLT